MLNNILQVNMNKSYTNINSLQVDIKKVECSDNYIACRKHVQVAYEQ